MIKLHIDVSVYRVYLAYKTAVQLGEVMLGVVLLNELKADVNMIYGSSGYCGC